MFHADFIPDVVRVGMGLLLAMAAPIGGDGQDWARWGLAGLLVGYTQWRDWHRENEMRSAREADQKWIREQMIPALANSTHALGETNKQLQRIKGAA